MSTPVPITATVTPPALSAPRWAAASIPRARPLTTITAERARSAASCSATASPYGDGRRDPTIATRGPAGGGQRPRARKVDRSGGGIVEPVAEGFENVTLVDAVGCLQVGRSARNAPRPVKASSGEPALLSPALQSLPRRCIESRHAPKACRIQLGIET